MPRLYDAEELVADIKALLVANLNAEIAIVEAEKVAAGRAASGIANVESGAYFLYEWTADSLNANPACGIFLSEQQIQSDGPFSKQTFIVDVGVVISGTDNDALAVQKLLRYGRALRQVFEKNWGKMNSAVTREKLESVGPIAFKVNADSSEQCKIAGVTLTVTLG